MHSSIRSALIGTAGMVAMVMGLVSHIDGDKTSAVASMGCAVLLFIVAIIVADR